MADIRHRCCICGSEFVGPGNNPSPVCDEGVCCRDCNWTVIFARLDAARRKTEKERTATWEN